MDPKDQMNHVAAMLGVEGPHVSVTTIQVVGFLQALQNDAVSELELFRGSHGGA